MAQHIPRKLCVFSWKIHDGGQLTWLTLDDNRGTFRRGFADRESEFSDKESENILEYNGNTCSSGSEEDNESGEEGERFEEHDSLSTSEDSESEEKNGAPKRGQRRGKSP